VTVNPVALTVERDTASTQVSEGGFATGGGTGVGVGATGGGVAALLHDVINITATTSTAKPDPDAHDFTLLIT